MNNKQLPFVSQNSKSVSLHLSPLSLLTYFNCQNSKQAYESLKSVSNKKYKSSCNAENVSKPWINKGKSVYSKQLDTTKKGRIQQKPALSSK